MPIRGKKQRFTNNNIDNAPDCDGIYVLTRYRETIYIGKGEGADGVKGRLKAAKGASRGRGKATSFLVERCKDPSKREIQLLEQYKKKHGVLPRYNDRIG